MCLCLCASFVQYADLRVECYAVLCCAVLYYAAVFCEKHICICVICECQSLYLCVHVSECQCLYPYAVCVVCVHACNVFVLSLHKGVPLNKVSCMQCRFGTAYQTSTYDQWRKRLSAPPQHQPHSRVVCASHTGSAAPLVTDSPSSPQLRTLSIPLQ